MQYFLLIGKKVIYDLLTEPERLAQKILIAVMAVIMIIFMFIIPIIIVTNVPLVYLSNGEETVKQEEILKMYKKDAIALAEANYQMWVNKQQERLKNEVDEITVNYDFNISYKELIAIDTILLQQDFTKVNISSICSLINEFVFTNIETGTYLRTYTDEEMEITGYKENGEAIWKMVQVQKEELVKYAVIEVSILNKNEVMNNLGFSEADKEYVKNYMNAINILEISNGLN